MASSNFRRELDSFRAVPKESLSRLGTRFDEVADPLIENEQMTARHLALHFVTHLPSHIRKAIVSCMRREDRKRFVDKRPYVTKNKLLAMAQEEEAWVLESEAEARAAGSPVHPRDTTEYKYPPLSSILKSHHVPTTPGHSDRLPFATHNCLADVGRKVRDKM